ncbi:twin-arginine translocase TatA/TatE family subunit [Patulibacter defluvii]|uniref:twin-arginine translocase TatA/TatE family subunit n=1 Tax=Patulibacter defluvii TaxID=3095358 RepID=UPI0035C8F2F8
MGPIGFPELLIILVVALLVLGPKRLPEVGKSLGKGMREFKESISAADPFDDDAPRRSADAATSAPPQRRPAAVAASSDRDNDA